MNTHKLSTLFLIPLALVLLILGGCRVESPVKEMTDARIAVARAESFQAAQYAPEEMAKARELLLASHTSVSGGDYALARKQALEALQYAEDAAQKARKPALEKLISALESERDATENLLPDTHAAFLHTEVKDRISAAKQALETDQLDLAEAQHKEGAELLAALKEQCLGNLAGYESSVRLMLANLEKMEKGEGAGFAGTDITACRTSSRQALEFLQKKDLSAALKELDTADRRYSAARLKILKGLATERLAKAQSLHSGLDSSVTAAHKTEIEQAEGFIGEGKALFEQFYYALVITKATGAIEILEKLAIEKPTGARMHVVRYIPGNTDTLVKLSFQYYGAWNLWPVIFQANRDQIKDPDIIYPGQKLVIPRDQKIRAVTKPVVFSFLPLRVRKKR
jgi:nucleoid-associated protein YgaU